MSTSLNFLAPVSYTTPLDYFRADYDENVWDNNNSYNLSTNNSNFNLTNNSFSLTNNIKLRSTAKNSIVTYNAIQKVYKSRFDDNRSNVNFKNFTNSFTSYPFLTESKVPYENILTKNKEYYFNINFYKTYSESNVSLMLDVYNSINTLFIDIPFLVSMKSDASRYL
jgi:hypothetical protein